MRSIDKGIAQGRKFVLTHKRTDLSLEEAEHIVDQFLRQEKKLSKGDLVTLIHNSFLMGVAIGARNS